MNNLFPIPSKYENINIISNGFYIIETKIIPNKALNIIYDYNKKIYTINLNKIKDKYSQVFYIEYQKDNSYLIKSILTNSFLEISEGINNRFPLSFNEKIEGDNQKWYIISNTNDYYFIVSKNDSKCVVDVNTDKVKNNLYVQCYSPNGKNNQLFKFISIKKVNPAKYLQLNFLIYCFYFFII